MKSSLNLRTNCPGPVRETAYGHADDIVPPPGHPQASRPASAIPFDLPLWELGVRTMNIVSIVGVCLAVALAAKTV